MPRIGVPLAAALALAAGCAHAPLTCPAHGGAAWSELASRHFVLRTDLPRNEARVALGQFEQSYAAFEELVFPSGRPPAGRIDFVLFRDDEDFRRLAPPGASGYFLSRTDGEAPEAPAIVMHGELLPNTRRRFQHELTHRFLSLHLRDAPPWVEEGLAEYYSTVELEPDRAIVGQLPVKRVLRTEIPDSITLLARFVENRVEYSELPTLRGLIDLDFASFHDDKHEMANYVAAWELVHMLESAPDLRGRFQRYLAALGGGVDPRVAWSDSFGDLDAAQLEARFKHYTLRPELPDSAAPFHPPEAPPPEEERRLSDAEVHLLWARVRPWNCRENIVAAGGDLRAALAAGSPSPELLYWKALYDRKWRRFELAERDLAGALAARPREARYWHALAALRYYSELEEPTHPLGSTEEATRRLAPLARSPWELDFLARWYADHGRRAEGLAFARRALEAGPGCWECVDTWAKLHQQAPSPPPPLAAPPRSVL